MKSRIVLCALLALALFCINGTTAQAQALRQTLVQKPPADLSQPARGAQWVIPVVSICYLPSADGVNLAPGATRDPITLAAMYDRVLAMTRQIKFSLEEGSRYHGYRDGNAPPSLGYEIVAIITVPEDVPYDPAEKKSKPGTHQIDYHRILERFGGRDWVNTTGVKEFWIWSYDAGTLEVSESNMSSPISGNISNSERRDDDMPIYDHTYIAYNYNYDRTEAEAVHNHGHQLEAMLTYINQKQDGNTVLFKQNFIGYDEKGQPTGGRCGWTHMPPNTPTNYDYINMYPISSDILDWTPAGGGRKWMVAANIWGDIPYSWPGGVVPEQKVEAQWYVFWRQNVPGLDNGIDDDGQPLTNWWQFVGDWDYTIVNDIGLHEGPVKTPWKEP